MKEIGFETIENIVKAAELGSVSSGLTGSVFIEGKTDDISVEFYCSQDRLGCNYMVSLKQGKNYLAELKHSISYLRRVNEESGDVRARDLFLKYAVPVLHETAIKEMQANEQLVDSIIKKYAAK